MIDHHLSPIAAPQEFSERRCPLSKVAGRLFRDRGVFEFSLISGAWWERGQNDTKWNQGGPRDLSKMNGAGTQFCRDSLHFSLLRAVIRL